MTAMTDAARQASRTGTTMGIVLVILGILAMMAPLVAGTMVAVLVGVLILAAGIARTMYAFKAESFGKGALKFLFGGLMILVGLAMVTHPLTGLASLTMVLIVFFLVDGLFEIVAAFKVKPQKGWGWLLFGGIVSVALAVLIWKQWPVSGAWAIGILLGIRMLFAGFSMIALGAVGERVVDAVEEAKEPAAPPPPPPPMPEPASAPEVEAPIPPQPAAPAPPPAPAAPSHDMGGGDDAGGDQDMDSGPEMGGGDEGPGHEGADEPEDEGNEGDGDRPQH